MLDMVLWYDEMGSIKKIALIQTVRFGVARPDIGLSLGYLKSYLNLHKPDKYEVDIIESNDFLDNITKYVGEYDLFGISAVSNQYAIAIKLGEIIKESSDKPPITLIGGAHISGLPSSISPVFDYGIVGEGERTFLELIEALNNNLIDEDILKIPGVVGKRKGQIIYGPKRELIENVDEIPFPDRLYFNKYRSVPSLMTARGCPFNCDFCVSRVMWGRKTRRNSPEKVVDELVEMTKVLDDIRVIVFRDDIVFLTEDYVTKLLEVAKKKAPEILSIPKVGYAHVTTVTGPMIRKLKEFGLIKIICGFESGSPKILKILKQGSATVEDNQRAIDIAYENGMDISGNFIIGVPEETEEDLKLTLDFVYRNVKSKKLGFGATNVLTPKPGTRYWDIFLKTGVNLETFNWNRMDEMGWITFYQNKDRKATIRDWWDDREKNNKIYLGGIPKERFISILEQYEPELTELQLDFLKKDQKY